MRSLPRRDDAVCARAIRTPASIIVVIPYLKFYPSPNGPQICPCSPGGHGDTANFSFAGSQITSENYFTTRVDHRFSNKDSLAGSYMYRQGPVLQNDEFNNKLILSQTRRQLVTLEETHLFSSSLVNTLRFGFNNIVAAAPSGGKAINPLLRIRVLGFTPGTRSAGIIGVPGLTDFSGGLSHPSPPLFHWHDYQVYDNVFLTKGIHSLKFGANVERIHDNQYRCMRQCAGNFQFDSLQDFLTNQPLPSSHPDSSDVLDQIREDLRRLRPGRHSLAPQSDD